MWWCSILRSMSFCKPPLDLLKSTMYHYYQKERTRLIFAICNIFANLPLLNLPPNIGHYTVQSPIGIIQYISPVPLFWSMLRNHAEMTLPPRDCCHQCIPKKLHISQPVLCSCLNAIINFELFLGNPVQNDKVQ